MAKRAADAARAGYLYATTARALAIKYYGSELTFVGHSLGGGETTATNAHTIENFTR